MLRWVIECIGLLSRLYPAEGRQQLSGIFESIKEIIVNENSDIQLETETVTCCVNALLLLGYHFQAQLAMFLVDWKPKQELDALTRERLENFVGTRGRKHADITSNISR